MTTVKNITAIIEAMAPRTLAEDWDNPGLAVGDEDAPVSKVLTALDCDEKVVDEAIQKGCDMIVCHHPLIFRPLGFVTTENAIGKVVLKAAKHGIAIYSAHTNLDCAPGGTNDFLCNLLGIKNVEICEDAGEGNLIRVGEIPPQPFEDFAKHIAKTLGKPYIRCVGNKEKIISTVGVCTGGGGEYIREMADKCQLYITGDVKYHMARDAEENGICIAVAEHFETERYAAEILRNILKEAGVEAICSEENKDVFYDIYTE